MEIGFRNIRKKSLMETYGKTFFCEEEYLNEILNEIYLAS
jgi:hypothetical protein